MRMAKDQQRNISNKIEILFILSIDLQNIFWELP